MPNFDYIKEYYDLPFIRKGIAVINFDGVHGTITGTNGSNIKVKFKDKRHNGFYNPTWEIAYLDEKGNILKDFRNETKS